MRTFAFVAAVVLGGFAAQGAEALTLTSPDIKPSGTIANEQVFNGWDCTGGNVSPALSWTGAPKGTKSFAVSVYDPDAPTGSGFWHWWVANLPAGHDRPAEGRGRRRRVFPPARCRPATTSARSATAAPARRRESRTAIRSPSTPSTSTSCRRRRERLARRVRLQRPRPHARQGDADRDVRSALRPPPAGLTPRRARRAGAARPKASTASDAANSNARATSAARVSSPEAKRTRERLGEHRGRRRAPPVVRRDAERHGEGRGDPGREDPLREGEDEHQDRARAGPRRRPRSRSPRRRARRADPRSPPRRARSRGPAGRRWARPPGRPQPKASAAGALQATPAKAGAAATALATLEPNSERRRAARAPLRHESHRPMAATPAQLATFSQSAAAFICDAVALTTSAATPTSATATAACKRAASSAMTIPRLSDLSLAIM